MRILSGWKHLWKSLVWRLSFLIPKSIYLKIIYENKSAVPKYSFLSWFYIVRGHIDKFCLQVHNFGKNEDKQMILTPNERSFYLAPDDISFFNIITVPFDTEPPPTDDLLDAVSEEVSSLVSAPRKNSILHIFVCLVTVALEVILKFWKRKKSLGARSGL